MKIVIIGNGDVGETLAASLCAEGYNVTVIDENADEVNAAVNRYDVFGITGNGASIEVQKEAGVPESDIVIAVSQSDELNLVCCMIAKRLGAKRCIARVREPEYLKQISFMSKQLGIDMILNPEFEAAREAARLIRFPAAMKLEKFAKGQVEAVEIHIGEKHPFIGIALKDFKNKFSTNTLICTAVRGEDVFIPGGDFVIEEGDSVSIVGSRQDINELFVKIGLIGKHLKNIVLIGGGRISKYLAKQLTDSGYKLKVIEKRLDACEELSELFPKTQIIHGDAADPELLDEENVAKSDACIAMTEDDRTNLLVSMFAHTRGVGKVISKIASSTYVKLAEDVGVDSNISPQHIIAARVLRYVRGQANRGAVGYKSAIKSLHKFADNKVEALEFDVAEDFPGTGVTLRELKLKSNILVAAIIREGTVIYPHGNSTLEVGDSVIVMTTRKQLCDLGDTLA